MLAEVAAPATAGRTESAHINRLLELHQYQGQTNDCAVNSVATVINTALGSNIDGAALGEDWGRIQWRGVRPVLRRIPRWAAFPWSMVAELRERGFTAEWRLLQPPQFLASQLAANHFIMPIIGSWKPLWAHTMILVASSPEQGYGFVNPAVNRKSLYWMPQEAFEKAWRAYGSTVVVAWLPDK
ncbi:MAG: hypothetical protein EPO32_00315 [Anaerolineae bacterium]|nr:MAG: hypothetical protein EPO32_00315 [Anaerolineae bacterium]